MPSAAHRVMLRFANRTYRWDRGKTDALLRGFNDPATRAESMRELGGYFEHRFEMVPLAKITIDPVWNEAKAQKVRQDMDAGKTLQAVRLSVVPGRTTFGIEDGIHRVNVSRERGYKVVPAIISEWVPTPEAKVVDPEKPKLKEGDWVELHTPMDGRRYGWVYEVLASTHVQGVQRHRYNVALVKPGDDWPDFVDLFDMSFEPVRTPSWGLKVREATGL